MDSMRLPQEYHDRLFKRHTLNHKAYDDNHELQQSIVSQISELGIPGNPFGIYQNQTIGEYSFYVTLQYLDQLNIDAKDFYVINSYGFRSEEFYSEHEGKHVLFAGCSVTFGDSMFIEDSWAKVLYNKLAETNSLSGYYNIGMPSASITDVASLLRTYIELIAIPDVVFINLPAIIRDDGAGIDDLKDIINTYTETEFITTSWDQTFTTESCSSDDPRLSIPGIVQFAQNDLLKYCYKMHKANKKEPFMLKGLDDSHPGIAEHSFYANLMLTNLGYNI